MNKATTLSQLCVVIPVYKSQLSDREHNSVARTISVMQSVDIFFVTYQELDKSEYEKYAEVKFRYFPSKYFQGIASYNKLLLSDRFYRAFRGYRYMLIVQTDAWIIRDKGYLQKIMNEKYDYWGAPWTYGADIHRLELAESYPALKKNAFFYEALLGKEKRCYVGNGGLSLRNIAKTRFLLKEKWFYRRFWKGNEDYFFAYHGTSNLIRYKVAPRKEAQKFSLELGMRNRIKRGHLPFGVHAWEKYYPEFMEECKDCLE